MVLCNVIRLIWWLKVSVRSMTLNLKRNIIIGLHFRRTLNDPSLFTRQSYLSLFLLLLYIDDIIVSSDDAERIEALMKGLHASLSLKELRSLSYFLGREVHNLQLVFSFLSTIMLMTFSTYSYCVSNSTPMELI
ncbi:unnamed protein product [Linum trigynum]|uniref:Reverse transcriptase Ty1/copia-type domain-containing protein n=1 Tax=Linum trigynum TaxID=586398 RepID=A0AAV2CZK0_9ROSI